MGKITKTQISATIDTWVVNWIRSQKTGLSKTINRILKDHIIAAADEPRRQKTLIELTPSERDRSFEAHMKRIYDEIGHPGESE